MKFASLLLLGAMALGLATQAAARTVDFTFPNDATAYDSATGGSGVIPTGGQSAWMYTAGDNVSWTVDTPITDVSVFKDNITLADFLAAGQPLYIGVDINGYDAGPMLVDGGQTLWDTGITAYIGPLRPLISPSGNYTITLTLLDTVPPGDGSVAFMDGGVASLTGTAVPEPGAWLMMLSGIALAGAAARRQRLRLSPVRAD